MTKEELAKYVADLGKEKGLSAAQIQQAVTLATGDDELAAVLGPIIDLPVGRHAEYSRSMDALKAKEQRYDGWYNDTAVPTVRTAIQEKTAALDRIAKYEARFGKLEETQDLGDGTSRTATGERVKTEDVSVLVDDKMKTWGRDTFQLMADQSRLQAEHFNRFGKFLDINPLLKICAEKGGNLDVAYNEIHGEAIKKLDTDARQKEIDDAVSKARLDERTRIAAATRAGASVQEGSGPFWDQMSEQAKKEGVTSDSDSERAFVADLNAELARNNAAASTQ